MDKFKDMKKDVNNQARLSKGVLSIKGKVQTQFLEPSVPESDMPAEIDQPKVAESNNIDDSGSHFKGLATNVGNVQELSTALNTVLTRPGVGVSSHVIYAYRYSDVQELSTALNTVLTRPGVGVSSHVIYAYRYSDVQELSTALNTVLTRPGVGVSSHVIYAYRYSDVQELSTALNTVLTRPGVGVSSHVIYAYRYSDGDDDVVENFHSDDDHGMGLDLLVKLREMDKNNILCVVTRHCDPGFVHLGPKRFQYSREVTDKALAGL